MKNARTRKSMIGAVIAVAAISALAGCTAADTNDAGPTEEPTAEEYTPTVTDEGAEIIAGIADCAQIAGEFGALAEGLELTNEALDSTAVFCDWFAADDETHSFSVEVLGMESDVVPAVEAVEASGGTVVEIAKVTEAGGIAYSIAGADGSAYSLTAAVPEYSISATLIGSEISDEQIQQITAGVESLLG